jgi:hypothetical protein
MSKPATTSARASKPTLGAVRAQRPQSVSPAPVAEPAADVALDVPAETVAGGPVDLDDVILAWGAILPDLAPSSRRALQDFQPVSVADDVVVFGIAPHLLDLAKPRFHQEAHTIRAELTSRLGRSIRFKLAGHEGFTAGNAAPRAPSHASPRPQPRRRVPAQSAEVTDDAPPPSEPPPEFDDEVDLTELRDAPAVPAVDSITRLQERFGASVVEELPRE